LTWSSPSPGFFYETKIGTRVGNPLALTEAQFGLFLFSWLLPLLANDGESGYSPSRPEVFLPFPSRLFLTLLSPQVSGPRRGLSTVPKTLRGDALSRAIFLLVSKAGPLPPASTALSAGNPCSLATAAFRRRPGGIPSLRGFFGLCLSFTVSSRFPAGRGTGPLRPLFAVVPASPRAARPTFF